MLEAFGDRPLIGCRLPRELVITERRDERVGISGNLLELSAELVDLAGKCKRALIHRLRRS
jgi:hypothetical protein